MNEIILPQTGGELGVELRGYEVAKRVGDRWEQVYKYAPTLPGYERALKDGRWLAERQPHNVFALRPIISLNPSAAQQGAEEAAAAPEVSTPPSADAPEPVSGPELSGSVECQHLPHYSCEACKVVGGEEVELGGEG
jgi:hypothetical protein